MRLFSLGHQEHYYSELPLGQLHCNWLDHLQKPSYTTVFQGHTSLLVMKANYPDVHRAIAREVHVHWVRTTPAMVLRDATLKEGAGQHCIHDIRPLNHSTTGFQR